MKPSGYVLAVRRAIAALEGRAPEFSVEDGGLIRIGTSLAAVWVHEGSRRCWDCFGTLPKNFAGRIEASPVVQSYTVRWRDVSGYQIEHSLFALDEEMALAVVGATDATAILQQEQ